MIECSSTVIGGGPIYSSINRNYDTSIPLIKPINWIADEFRWVIENNWNDSESLYFSNHVTSPHCRASLPPPLTPKARERAHSAKYVLATSEGPSGWLDIHIFTQEFKYIFANWGLSHNRPEGHEQMFFAISAMIFFFHPHQLRMFPRVHSNFPHKNIELMAFNNYVLLPFEASDILIHEWRTKHTSELGYAGAGYLDQVPCE